MPTFCPSCAAANLEGADVCANCGMALTMTDVPRADSPFEAKLMESPLMALNLTAPRTIRPDQPLKDAVALLAEGEADLLSVVERDQLIGVLSVRDLLTRIGSAYSERLDRPVREFMTSQPIALPPDAPITFALNKMDVGGYRHVPVVQDGRLLGLVSSRDVLRYVMRNKKQTVVTRDKTQSHGPETKAVQNS